MLGIDYFYIMVNLTSLRQGGFTKILRLELRLIYVMFFQLVMQSVSVYLVLFNCGSHTLITQMR